MGEDSVVFYQRAQGKDRERETMGEGAHMKNCEGYCGCYLLSGVGRLSESNLATPTFLVRQTDGLRAKACL